MGFVPSCNTFLIKHHGLRLPTPMPTRALSKKVTIKEHISLAQAVMFCYSVLQHFHIMQVKFASAINLQQPQHKHAW